MGGVRIMGKAEGAVRVFHGVRGEHGATVYVQAESARGAGLRQLDMRLDLRSHSPTGFEWGYGGSGPSQLALALCAAVVGDRRAQVIYQDFKRRVIEPIQASEWWMDEVTIRAQIEQLERAREPL